MCSVSYISEPYALKWAPLVNPPAPNTIINVDIPPVGRFEFDALRAEVAALKDLLKAAKVFDERTGQKDCEHEDKIAVLRKVADLVGVDLSEVFGAPKP